jgi:hypothetical protein
MRPSFTERTRRRGASLTELLICCGLMSVIMLGVTLVLTRGMRFYRINMEMQESQRQAMLMLLTIAADIQNTRSSLLYFNSSGVSFADPYNDSNIFEFDTANDLLYWHAYRTYYVTGREFRYIREKIPKTTNPAPPDQAVPPVTPQGYAGVTTSKLLLSDVSAFNVTKRLKDTTKSELQDLYIVNVEIGRKGDKDWFWLALTTATSPRNDGN